MTAHMGNQSQIAHTCSFFFQYFTSFFYSSSVLCFSYITYVIIINQFYRLVRQHNSRQQIDYILMESTTY